MSKNFFLKKELFLFIVLFFLGIIANWFYYIFNKPKVNQNYINIYKKEYFLTLKKEQNLLKKLEKEKEIFNYYVKLTFSNQELNKYQKFFNLLLNTTGVKCSFFGKTKDNIYFNVINFYYDCGDSENAEIAKDILRYFKGRLKLNFIKNIEVKTNRYLLITIYKKVNKVD